MVVASFEEMVVCAFERMLLCRFELIVARPGWGARVRRRNQICEAAAEQPMRIRKQKHGEVEKEG